MNNIPLMSRDIVDAFIRSGDKYQTVNTDKTSRSKISVYNALLGYTRRHDNLQVSVRMVKGNVVLVNDKLHHVDVTTENEEYRENPTVC